MLTEGNKIIKYNHGEKSLKAPYTVITNLECILSKTSSCQNIRKESYTEKKS